MGGERYFKLLTAEASVDFLLRRDATLELPIDAEIGAACGAWLREEYIRQASRARGYTDAAPTTWLAGFPVVHFARSGELAPLLRFPIQLTWLDRAGRPFEPPDPKTRRGRGPLEGPTSVHLSWPPEDGEDDGPQWPYAVDTLLLSRTLGVAEEDLAAFNEALRPLQSPSPDHQLAAVASLLTLAGDVDWALPEARPFASSAEALSALMEAARPRLADGPATIYPVGLVYDGTRVAATLHLQRELAAAKLHSETDTSSQLPQ